MVGKPSEKRERIGCKRRRFIQCGAAVSAVATVPGMAAANNSSVTRPSSDADSAGVTAELIEEGDQYKLFRTTSDDGISVGKFYTAGPKKGKLEHAPIGTVNGGDTRRVSTLDEVSVDQTAGLAAVERNGLEIVKRSKNVNRTLDSCSENYCNGFTYTHVQTGFTVEFTDVIDAFGKSVIAEAISILAEAYVKARWARWIGSFASIIAGTLLSLATGAEYTVSPWDQDKGWIFTNPVVELGVSGGWDTHAHDLTNIRDNERAHIGSLDGRCG